jgi:hypothetical protein
MMAPFAGVVFEIDDVAASLTLEQSHDQQGLRDEMQSRRDLRLVARAERLDIEKKAPGRRGSPGPCL